MGKPVATNLHGIDDHLFQYIFIFYADNVAIHHTDEVVDAINATRALLLFLSPYSPDYMPCEGIFLQVELDKG